jgi:chemotaxis protein methyltransferase CheR
MQSSFVPGIPLHGAVSLLRNLVQEQTGLYFDDARCGLLIDKLAPLIGGRAPDAVLHYYYLLKYDSGARDEWRKIFDALTIQESFFWREMDQVRALVDEIVPQYFSSNPDETLDIWSAACAGGEEPLSIAMALHEAGWFDKARINIHASDASPRAIQGAQSGIFAERSFRSLPLELREKYFVEAEGGMRISCDLRARVRWQITNLMSESDLLWAPTGSQIHLLFRERHSQNRSCLCGTDEETRLPFPGCGRIAAADTHRI